MVEVRRWVAYNYYPPTPIQPLQQTAHNSVINQISRHSCSKRTLQLSANPFAILLLGGGRRWVSYNYYPPTPLQPSVTDSPQHRHAPDFETFMPSWLEPARQYRVIILSHLKSRERHIEARDISSITGHVVRLAPISIQLLVKDSPQ